MKSIRLLSFAAAIGCSAFDCCAQLKLFGEVTSVSGYFTGTFAPRDPVVIHVNLWDSHWGDLYHGTMPGHALYFASGSVTIGSMPLSLPELAPGHHLNIRFDDPASPDAAEGFNIGFSWGTPEVSLNLIQRFFSSHDIMSGVETFPAHVPIEQFFARDGSFSSYLPEPGEAVLTGEVLWNITSYTGSLKVGEIPDITPVPEPSLIGVVAVGLVGLCAIVRFRINIRPSSGGLNLVP